MRRPIEGERWRLFRINYSVHIFLILNPLFRTFIQYAVKSFMFDSNEMINFLEDDLACFAAGLLWPVTTNFHHNTQTSSTF